GWITVAEPVVRCRTRDPFGNTFEPAAIRARGRLIRADEQTAAGPSCRAGAPVERRRDPCPRSATPRANPPRIGQGSLGGRARERAKRRESLADPSATTAHPQD